MNADQKWIAEIADIARHRRDRKTLNQGRVE